MEIFLKRLEHQSAQFIKRTEVLQMGRVPFGVFPQFFNRVIVRRERRQGLKGEALGVLGLELLNFLAAMLRRPVVDQDNRRLNLFQQLGEEFDVVLS